MTMWNEILLSNSVARHFTRFYVVYYSSGFYIKSFVQFLAKSDAQSALTSKSESDLDLRTGSGRSDGDVDLRKEVSRSEGDLDLRKEGRRRDGDIDLRAAARKDDGDVDLRKAAGNTDKDVDLRERDMDLRAGNRNEDVDLRAGKREEDMDLRAVKKEGDMDLRKDRLSVPDLDLRKSRKSPTKGTYHNFSELILVLLVVYQTLCAMVSTRFMYMECCLTNAKLALISSYDIVLSYLLLDRAISLMIIRLQNLCPVVLMKYPISKAYTKTFRSISFWAYIIHYSTRVSLSLLSAVEGKKRQDNASYEHPDKKKSRKSPLEKSPLKRGDRKRHGDDGAGDLELKKDSDTDKGLILDRQ